MNSSPKLSKETMLKVIAGPMFAGKTTALLKHIRAVPEHERIVFKPSIDNRYAKDECVSHNGDKIPAVNVDRNAPNFFQHITSEVKHVFIDELNFFEFDKIFPEIQKLLERGIQVIGAGLLFDVRKEEFGSTLALSQRADQFEKLYAFCDNCGEQAAHTYRKIDAKEQIVIGAADLYGACCDECWEDLQK